MELRTGQCPFAGQVQEGTVAETQTVHSHLAGALAPVCSENDFEREVVGRIPVALAGAYYRNGPNPQFDPQGMHLSIFGDGLIHGTFLELEPKRTLARIRGAARASTALD